MTEFTPDAEKITGRLTGIPIEIRITQAEQRLREGCFCNREREIVHRVKRLNERGLELADHVLREANHYLRILQEEK